MAVVTAKKKRKPGKQYRVKAAVFVEIKEPSQNETVTRPFDVQLKASGVRSITVAILRYDVAAHVWVQVGSKPAAPPVSPAVYWTATFTAADVTATPAGPNDLITAVGVVSATTSVGAPSVSVRIC